MRKAIPIIILLILAAVFTFVESSDREWISDDISYRFICEDDSIYMDASRMREIRTVADICESQAYHYIYMNGRLPVHFIVQFFDGITGKTLFALFNSAVMVLAIILCGRVGRGKSTKGVPHHWYDLDPWYYLIATLALFYLFPVQTDGRLWFSPAMGINYLWSSTIFMAFLYYFNRCERVSIWLMLLALLTGWSHEAFSIALSGGTFLYMIFRRRKINRGQIAMTFMLWVGTALIVFAPGTLYRASDPALSESLLVRAINTIKAWSEIKVLWILLLFIVVTAMTKGWHFLRLYFRENILIVFILVTGLLLSIYAHGVTRALTCVELTSLLLVLRLIGAWKFRIPGKRTSTGELSLLLYGLLLCLFAGYETTIIRCNMKTHREYLAMIERYRTSPDGATYITIPGDYGIASPYVNRYFNELFPSHFAATKFARLYRKSDYLEPLILQPTDYRNMIEKPDSFLTCTEPVEGTARAFKGTTFYFKKTAEAETKVAVPENKIYRVSACPDKMNSIMAPLYRLFYRYKTRNHKEPQLLESETIVTRAGHYDIIRNSMKIPCRIDTLINE